MQLRHSHSSMGWNPWCVRMMSWGRRERRPVWAAVKRSFRNACCKRHGAQVSSCSSSRESRWGKKKEEKERKVIDWWKVGCSGGAHCLAWPLRNWATWGHLVSITWPFTRKNVLMPRCRRVIKGERERKTYRHTGRKEPTSQHQPSAQGHDSSRQGASVYLGPLFAAV